MQCQCNARWRGRRRRTSRQERQWPIGDYAPPTDVSYALCGGGSLKTRQPTASTIQAWDHPRMRTTTDRRDRNATSQRKCDGGEGCGGMGKATRRTTGGHTAQDMGAADEKASKKWRRLNSSATTTTKKPWDETRTRCLQRKATSNTSKRGKEKSKQNMSIHRMRPTDLQ